MEEKKRYYLGFDIGTDSVGWAVTNPDYTIPKFNGNAMWGIRLFDESNTAEERRQHRSDRRRNQRKRERLSLLEMLFNEEISKTDVAFFQRLKESNLYSEDKSVGGKYSVFSDDNYTDKDFYKAYPTIYHLRKELIYNSAEHDARLVFIALHHLIKNRGHFLFESLNVEDIDNFELVYNDFVSYIEDNLELALNCSDVQKLSGILKNKKLGKTAKTTEVASLFDVSKKEVQAYTILSLLCGASVDLYKIFDDETLKEAEKKKIAFSGKFDDEASEYQAILGERFEAIEKIKAVYDWAILADILNGEKYISDAKVKVYEKHKSDLALLKEYLKNYLPNKYNEVFKTTKSGLNNYVAYTGHIKRNGKTGVLDGKTCSQEDFCAYLKKLLANNSDKKYQEMINEIELGTFMPKQVNKNNGVIPMQVHEKELKAILNNAKDYLPFLNSEDESGFSVYEKIIAIFEYRIPYYVGPLNTHSKNSWLVRSDEKIFPWNIRDVVDMDKTAEAFIENLTSKCTYLCDKDVIPKNSLLYTRFMVLNELNNLKIDGQPISVELKQSIYNDLFANYNKVTNKKLRDYLKSKGISFESVTGIDGDFKSNLKPYRDLADYDLSYDEKEQLIMAITIFGDDKKLLKKRIRNLFKDRLSDSETGKIAKLRYSGWSNLSKEFLCDVTCVSKETGEIVNIITSLWESNDNLMQLLYSDLYEPAFVKRVGELNNFGEDKSMREMVEELYVSPKVKRPIYQALQIAREIEKIQKCKPEKIFIEVARGEEKKERKVSRKQKLLDLYKDCKKENAELYEALLGEDEDRLRSDKLFFYYSQLGRDMYTGESINIDNLMGANSYYDIDHIFPRSKVKDDSLDNRVLVNKTVNANKTNEYPLSSSIREKMAAFWFMLKSKGFISDKKYDRLMRSYPLSDDELSAFISRQLVETRQSTKAAAQILEHLYPKPETEVVYVKAALASDFRHQFDMLKCREVNDLHHAKDAYLNIVVGNVYNVKFTHNKGAFISGLQQTGAKGFSLNKIFEFDTKGAWNKDNSLSIVKKTMNKNNILYTRYSYVQKGGLFDQMLVKKGGGQVPIKGNGAISQLEKYGGYNRPSSKYFALVEYCDNKGKTIRQLLPIDAYAEKDYLNNPDSFASAVVGYESKVIIPCIKYNSCLEFDGFRMHISSKDSGGLRFCYKPAVQLVLGYENEKYIRNIVKYLSDFSHRNVNSFDHISKVTNNSIYRMLYCKMLSSVYGVKFKSLGLKLKEAEEDFSKISIEKQCVIIYELIKLLHSNTINADLKVLGDMKNSAILRMNSKISEIKNIASVKLVNQSITGLFETKTELLKQEQ